MNFHVLTLFPEMIEQGVNTSITGRAITKGLLSLEAINIRDFAFNKHQKVDDYPYGGGAGMLMQAEPVYLSYESIVERIGRKPRVIFLTPQGKTFNQNMAKEFALEEDLVFLCGHYEGIDERVLEEIVTDYVSIGDYVLTGGELPAMVMMDSISRMVPGVLNNGMEKKFRRCCFPDIMQMWINGEESSLLSVLPNGDRICCQRPILQTKSGTRSAGFANNGKRKWKNNYENIRFLL